MSAKLILTRKGEFANRRQRYKVLINGKEAGLIKNDSTEEYVLDAGTYTVECRLNWTGSGEHTVHLEEGKNTYIKVSSGMKLILPLYLMMFVGVFFPLYFQFSKLPLPAATGILKPVLILPGILYFVFYLTINRKKYLVIEDDRSNVLS